MQLAQRLIEEHKVAVIPGTTFGIQDQCLLRVAYGALQKDTAAEGIGRLVRGLRQILAPTDHSHAMDSRIDSDSLEAGVVYGTSVQTDSLVPAGRILRLRGRLQHG